MTIPEVDYASPNASEQLRLACTTVGFFYLVNHGISDALIAQVYQEMTLFFSQPLEDKRLVLANKYMRGYTLMSEETLNPSVQIKGDTKEGYYICRHVPLDSDEMKLPLHGPNIFPNKAKFPTFQETMETYYAAMCQLAFNVARLFAEAAGEKGKFDGLGMFDKPMAALRLLHYSPEKADVNKGIFGAGAHTDYGLVTLLSTDMTGGLQILHEEKWMDVPPRRDAFVVNIGDMAERFTNGKFKSTRHRVVNVSGKDRYSVPFFYDPNFTCQVECFPSCVTDKNPARYPPTTSGQHLLDMYKQTYAAFGNCQ
ncbi:gibberellin 2-beta-dioxygenase [Plasmopara halstedii]|uniref:Gibberellin 2-beta-dioxygenase n=1 Tax=Plasmopara halstedii TaxID=4781 RepID=A0A0P1AZ76_PLAHL|nr:gibberellin 2-beta-dioxygenase [Plasmopara halstedii]CEG46122.1 gibberellin 2-beta-dioxygenase [Plasmopara halstedii]|eukprot:XP_024582491.1 gibberellin 2-beta-dioxygenase [Plasmopara halstedii]